MCCLYPHANSDYFRTHYWLPGFYKLEWVYSLRGKKLMFNCSLRSSPFSKRYCWNKRCSEDPLSPEDSRNAAQLLLHDTKNIANMIYLQLDLNIVYSIYFSGILCFLTLLTILSTIYDYSTSSGKQIQKLKPNILFWWKISYFWLFTKINYFYMYRLMSK